MMLKTFFIWIEKQRVEKSVWGKNVLRFVIRVVVLEKDITVCRCFSRQPKPGILIVNVAEAFEFRVDRGLIFPRFSTPITFYRDKDKGTEKHNKLKKKCQNYLAIHSVTYLRLVYFLELFNWVTRCSKPKNHDNGQWSLPSLLLYYKRVHWSLHWLQLLLLYLFSIHPDSTKPTNEYDSTTRDECYVAGSLVLFNNLRQYIYIYIYRAHIFILNFFLLRRGYKIMNPGIGFLSIRAVEQRTRVHDTILSISYIFFSFNIIYYFIFNYTFFLSVHYLPAE